VELAGGHVWGHLMTIGEGARGEGCLISTR
jgi:hypothetical protein